MELRQQIEKWEQERKDAHPESRADMDVAKRLLSHGIEALDRIAALEADLAAAQSAATTLAVRMHRQHYAEDAPNWQPLLNLVGLLTQIDNMYSGLREDLAAAQAELLVCQEGSSALASELIAARTERDERQDMANVGEALMETIKRNLSPHWSWNDCPSEVVVDLINERDEARAEAAALRKLAEAIAGGDGDACLMAKQTLSMIGQARKEGGNG